MLCSQRCLLLRRNSLFIVLVLSQCEEFWDICSVCSYIVEFLCYLLNVDVVGFMKRRVRLYYCRVEIVWLFEMAVQFTVGEKFARCSDLEQKVADFQRINHVDIYKRDSRSIDSAIRRKSISAVKVSSPDSKIRLRYVISKREVGQKWLNFWSLT